MANESDNTEHRAGEDESFASLMKLAGERAEIPLSVESRVYHRVQEEWKKSAVEPNADKVYDEVHKTWRRDSLHGKILRWLLPAGDAAAAIIATLVI